MCCNIQYTTEKIGKAQGDFTECSVTSYLNHRQIATKAGENFIYECQKYRGVLLHDKGQHEDLYASLDSYVGVRRDDSAIIKPFRLFLHRADLREPHLFRLNYTSNSALLLFPGLYLVFIFFARLGIYSLVG